MSIALKPANTAVTTRQSSVLSSCDPVYNFTFRKKKKNQHVPSGAIYCTILAFMTIWFDYTAGSKGAVHKGRRI